MGKKYPDKVTVYVPPRDQKMVADLKEILYREEKSLSSITLEAWKAFFTKHQIHHSKD